MRLWEIFRSLITVNIYLEVLLGQLGEAVLVEVVDLVHIALLDHVLEILQELLHLIWHSVVQPVLDWISSVAVARVLVLVVIVVRIHLGCQISRRLLCK